MKVLITAPSLDEKINVSGISTLVRQIVKSGAADFHHFRAGRSDAEQSGINWLVQQTLLIPRFQRTIRSEKIEMVHINTALVPLSIVRDAALVFAARRAKLPVLLHLHGGRFLMDDFNNRILERITGRMLRAADMVLVLSEHEKTSLTRRWQNLNVKILPNAVAVDEVPTIAKASANEKTIIFLGRLHESKGLHEIVEACRVLTNENYNFQFRCFGAGALKEFFTKEMSAILGGKFYFGGVISGAEKWKELAASDIFLLPSRYGEGLPIAMLEAMAAKCVVIAADVASVRHVIKDGANGFLVEPYNAAQTIEKLKFLLSDRADYETLRRNARATVAENFAFSDYTVKLENIYTELVKSQ
ncbi:MAG: glycosyltransferase family 4 protein [Acidobacteriota bacterium]|nr:glycosyltransferase family 4 protein [Acidobacteriota bacterium]